MGQLDDFSLDQVAGASALIISSIGGLLLIVFKSRCKTISCCWGMWSCIREINDEEEDDEENDEEKIVPKKTEEQPIIQEEQTIQD